MIDPFQSVFECSLPSSAFRLCISGPPQVDASQRLLIYYVVTSLEAAAGVL